MGAKPKSSGLCKKGIILLSNFSSACFYHYFTGIFHSDLSQVAHFIAFYDFPVLTLVVYTFLRLHNESFLLVHAKTVQGFPSVFLVCFSCHFLVFLISLLYSSQEDKNYMTFFTNGGENSSMMS